MSITGGALKAPAGSIHVAGVAEVPLDPRNTTALAVKNFGPVNITGGSTLDVSNPTTITAGETEIGGKGFPQYFRSQSETLILSQEGFRLMVISNPTGISGYQRVATSIVIELQLI